MTEKELMNEVFDSVLVTAGTILISMISKKLLREPLTSAENVRSYFKLAVGISSSTLAVKYLQKKNIYQKTLLTINRYTV